ncbi:MAG: AMP-binding protein, partial [Coriobacteriaceae bacterium]|nr:AMP-binding protein [Coriobacteriaceae bacterium]
MRGILDAIDDHARFFPEKIAYHLSSGAPVSDNNQGDNQLTYQQLITYANKLAFYLQEALKDDHSPLVVFGHKSPWMLICFLACVKSGRAYCPIDVSVPVERVRDIIIQAASPLVFALEELKVAPAESVTITAAEVMAICTGMTAEIDGTHRVGRDDVFYIIFTSGSSGTPKGVKITTDCLENFVRWAVTLGDLERIVESPTIINQAPLSFDLSVMDLYLSLYLGGTIWAVDRDTQDNMRRLLE